MDEIHVSPSLKLSLKWSYISARSNSNNNSNNLFAFLSDFLSPSHFFYIVVLFFGTIHFKTPFTYQHFILSFFLSKIVTSLNQVGDYWKVWDYWSKLVSLIPPLCKIATLIVDKSLLHLYFRLILNSL